MSAFGRRGGMTGGQPSRTAFGVAKPMQGGGPAGRPEPEGGDQFPPIDTVGLPGGSDQETGNMPGVQQDAMQRLADRQNASGDAGNHVPEIVAGLRSC